MNTAPLDRDADAIYSRLVAEAAAAGLVVYAYGGVAVLNTPAEQRTTGDRARTLQMASLAEHPDNPRPSRADDAPAEAPAPAPAVIEESGDLFGDASQEPE